MPYRSKKANRNRVSKKKNQNRFAIRRSKRGGANNNANNNLSISRSELEELNSMINKHAEEMKVEGLLGVSRMVDRLLNKQPVSMESNESITQSMIMSEQEGNDVKAKAMSMGMNMLGNMKTDSGTENNDTENDDNGDPNEASSDDNNDANDDDNDANDANDANDDNEESNGDANETSNVDDANGDPNEASNEESNGGDNKASNTGMTGGGLYKRFFKSKKNKKSVYL